MGGDASSTVDDMLKRLNQYSGVVGYVVFNADTIPVKTNLDPALSVQYAGHISQLVSRARTVVKQLEPRYAKLSCNTQKVAQLPGIPPPSCNTVCHPPGRQALVTFFLFACAPASTNLSWRPAQIVHRILHSSLYSLYHHPRLHRNTHTKHLAATYCNHAHHQSSNYNRPRGSCSPAGSCAATCTTTLPVERPECRYCTASGTDASPTKRRGSTATRSVPLRISACSLSRCFRNSRVWLSRKKPVVCARCGKNPMWKSTQRGRVHRVGEHIGKEST